MVIKNKMVEVRTILEDPTKTTVRLVVNPEKMVISETKRAYSYLSLYNKNVECLIINRVYPEGIEGDYFKSKYAEQEKYLEYIHQVFDPMKMLYAYQMPSELVGWEMPSKLADDLYGDSDPAAIYSDRSPLRFESEGREHRIVMDLPFTEKGDVQLFRAKDDSVIVLVGSQKCNIALPDTLRGAKMKGAELTEHKLIIRFEKEET
jgi:arsenite-transporting ATPase